MMEHIHLSQRLFEIGMALIGLLGSALLTVRYYLHCRVKELQIQAKIRIQKIKDRAQVFRDLVDEFRKEVSRLNVITQSHASKLTETIATCAEMGGKLHAAIADIDSLKRQMGEQSPKLLEAISQLHGVVSAIQADFDAAKRRLYEKPIAGSGGLHQLKEEKKK